MLRALGLAVLAAFVGISCAHADDAVARGQYLAVLGDCAGCHSTPHGAPFGGGLPFTAAFGTVYSTNITPDKATGLGNWSKDDFYRALHQGIAKDGGHLYPAFPYAYFTRLSRTDTDDLWAYLKSLKPVHAPARPNRLLFPFNIRAVMLFWNWLYLDDRPFTPDPAQSAPWNRGAYIINGLGHCAACHTPKDMLFGDETDKNLTGAVVGGWFAANLTGSPRGGLGKWSVAEITRFLATGRNQYATAAGTMQEKVSLSTSHMREDDRLAIATYLKSLPGASVAEDATPEANQMRQGEAIFVANCSGCHAPQGVPDPPSQNGLPDYPKLAGDTLVLGRDPTTVAHIVLEGASSPVTPNESTTFSMPAFAAMPDGDIADVVTYIRNAWGNKAPPISAGQVSRLRAAITSAPN